MKIRITILIFTVFLGLTGCSTQTNSSQIRGVITDPVERTIKIGGETLKVSEKGAFNFERDMERPLLLDISYADLEWTVFLMPGSSLKVEISRQNLNSIKYRGDLIPSNTYLLATDGVNQNINTYLSQNWVEIHQQNQEDYIETIDSLKGLYLEHLTADPLAFPSLSTAFVKAWKTEINFAFNKIMLYYPKNHFYYTGESVELSDLSIQYIWVPEIDALECFDLPSYKDYAEDWIDYQSERLAEKGPGLKHYNLVQMDAVVKLIPETFTTQYLKDFWYGQYLKVFIENNGISNSRPFIENFEKSCKTEEFKSELQQYIASAVDLRSDHEVNIFKTENAFHLEAHIFKPEELQAEEKRPAIVIFHGGGWNGGNPSWAFEKAKHFRELGMVAVAAQYRLGNTHDITAIESMSDARDLIMWMRLNADSLNIEPDSIVAYGWSAGAHLVSSSAIFSESIPGGTINSIPNAMILISPAVSLPKGRSWEGWKFNVFGPTTTVSSANPVEHVREGLPPTIILQGRDDTVTPLDGVQDFHDQMMAYGNHCELYIYDDVGHLFTPNTMPDNGAPHPDLEVQKRAYDQADLFLKTQGYTETE